MKNKFASLQVSLISWYKDNHRDLPWRQTRDPYSIWISEVMLQQTTVTAVKPYYDRFLKTFPNLSTLARAPLEDVLVAWAGLGYYSRAKNLHKAAQRLDVMESFPRHAHELEKLPGFGPYTSRAVATFAFNEKVGVLDGNVIRLLSRFFDLPVQHWLPRERAILQEKADALAQIDDAHSLNQALIELGSTLCTPQNPSCFLCPWSKDCGARKQDRIESLPLKKPKPKNEIWLWKPEIHMKKGKIALIQNDYLPFLKGQWILPGTSKVLPRKPKTFDAQHGITRFDIYIQIQNKKGSPLKKGTWVSPKDLQKWNPTNLLQKVIQQVMK